MEDITNLNGHSDAMKTCPLHAAMPVLVALAAATVLLWPEGAAACTTCAGMYTEFSLMGEIIYQVEKVHSGMMQALAGAEAAAQSGRMTQAALLPLGLGFSYGALHALGPGHGKLVVAGYFAGRTAPAREALRMAGEIAVLHVGSAALIAILAAILLGGVIDASGPAFLTVKLISYALIAAAGAMMLYRAAALWLAPRGITLPWPGGIAQAGCGCGHDHDHDHKHDHAHSAASSARERGLLSLAVGAVPCTGALIAVLFALASGAWLLGLLAVAAISLGMGVTLAGVGLFTIWTRGSIAPGSSTALSGFSAAGGMLVMLVGAALFYGTAAA
jgi:nickel/cobalt transporter (NicO) family protein